MITRHRMRGTRARRTSLEPRQGPTRAWHTVYSLQSDPEKSVEMAIVPHRAGGRAPRLNRECAKRDAAARTTVHTPKPQHAQYVLSHASFMRRGAIVRDFYVAAMHASLINPF